MKRKTSSRLTRIRTVIKVIDASKYTDKDPSFVKITVCKLSAFTDNKV